MPFHSPIPPRPTYAYRIALAETNLQFRQTAHVVKNGQCGIANVEDFLRTSQEDRIDFDEQQSYLIVIEIFVVDDFIGTVDHVAFRQRFSIGMHTEHFTGEFNETSLGALLEAEE